MLEILSKTNLPLASALRGSKMYIVEKRALIDTQNTLFLDLIRKNENAKNMNTKTATKTNAFILLLQ